MAALRRMIVVPQSASARPIGCRSAKPRFKRARPRSANLSAPTCIWLALTGEPARGAPNPSRPCADTVWFVSLRRRARLPARGFPFAVALRRNGVPGLSACDDLPALLTVGLAGACHADHPMGGGCTQSLMPQSIRPCLRRPPLSHTFSIDERSKAHERFLV